MSQSDILENSAKKATKSIIPTLSPKEKAIKYGINDECYTPFQKVAAEVGKWGAMGKFKDKKLICPCDWDLKDNVYKIEMDFKKNIAKIHTWKSDYIEQEITEDLIKLSQEFECPFGRFLFQNRKQYGIRTLTLQGYDPKKQLGIPFQEVDFSKYDVVITNPPFSQMREFVETLIKYKVDFCFLSAFLNRVTPNIGLHLMLKECYLGYHIHDSIEFYSPQINNNKKVAVDWIVSWPDAQLERNKIFSQSLITIKDLKDLEYFDQITMKDGTHPINIANFTYYPNDYYGWAKVSIGALDKMSEDEFEWIGTSFQAYFNTINPSANPMKHKFDSKRLKLNGILKFHGLLIKRKKGGNK